MAHEVFISYAKEDERVADAVCRTLEEGGVRCWYAPRDVPYLVDYEEAIIDAISQSKLMLLVLSEHANASAHVKREVQNACREEPQIPILPFQIVDVPLSKSFRYYIGSVQWLVASTPPLESHLQKLVNYVQQRLPQSERDRDSTIQSNQAAQAEIVEKDEEEASRHAQEELRLAEEAERLRVEEEERLAAEAELQRKAEEERQRREAEEKRRAKEEEETQRRLAEEEAAQRAADERRREEEEKERREAAERQRLEAEEAARRQAEEERVRAEAEARQRAEQEEAERLRVVVEQEAERLRRRQARAKEERLKQEAAEATRRAEEERQQREEEEKRKREAAEIKQRREEEERQEKERQEEERRASEARFRESNLANERKPPAQSSSGITTEEVFAPASTNRRGMFIALGALAVLVIVIAVVSKSGGRNGQEHSSRQFAAPTSTPWPDNTNAGSTNTYAGTNTNTYNTNTYPSSTNMNSNLNGPVTAATLDKAAFERKLSAIIRESQPMNETLDNGDSPVLVTGTRKHKFGDLDGDGDEDAVLWFCGGASAEGPKVWCRLEVFRNIDGELTKVAFDAFDQLELVKSDLDSIAEDGNIILNVFRWRDIYSSYTTIQRKLNLNDGTLKFY